MASLLHCSIPSSSLPSNRKQWNKIIKHNVLEGNPDQAILMYRTMLQSGYNGDNFTYPILLKASAHLHSSQTMILIHGHAIKTGFSNHNFVETSLFTAYAKLGFVENARKLFDKMSKRDLISWNSMLDVYVSRGLMDEAIKHFDLMPLKDNISFNIMISGYAKVGNVKSAKEIFDKVAVRDVVSWNSMVLAYAKAGDMEQARKLFDEMPEKNIISWNTMFTGYLENELYLDSISLFDDMKKEGFELNHITISAVLSACANIGLAETGKEIHIFALFTGLTSNPRVVTGLIDMYSKCGNIDGALEVFYKSQVKDMTCWNAILGGLALHGQSRAALKLFDGYRDKNMKPDEITFVSLLTACSHGGLVNEGWNLFEVMEKDYGILPKSEHYGCMVDILGRAGFLHSAYRLIRRMPFEPGATVYGALLGACVVHRNLEIGTMIAEKITKRVNRLSDGEYMMLANLYASCGKWEEANKWRNEMNESKISKTAGYSMIEVNGRMFKFLAGDTKQLSLNKV